MFIVVDNTLEINIDLSVVSTVSMLCRLELTQDEWAFFVHSLLFECSFCCNGNEVVLLYCCWYVEVR